MSEAEYVMCKWKNRLWPAKVLPKRNGSQRRPELKKESAFLRVEIFSLNKQADVRFIDTQPLKEETVKDIAAKLEQQPKHCKGTEELVYRRALREALIILNQCAEPGGFRSRGRRGQKSGQKTPPSLAAYHDHLSFPEGPPEKEGRAKVTEMPPFPEITLSKTENPLDLTASPKCQPSMSELQEIPGDGHCASSEEPEILAELYTDGSILCPSKEAKKHLRVGESPPLSILASPNMYVGLTPSGQNVECQPGQGKASPVAQGSPNRTRCSLSRRGAEKGPDGGQDSGSPPGAFRKEPSTISPTCLKSQDGQQPAAPADHVVSQPSKKFKMATRITQRSEATCPRGHHEMLSLARGPPESSVPKATTEENQNASPEMRLTRPQDFEESPLALPQRLSPRGETHHCLAVKDDEEEDDELPRILWYEEAPPPLEPGMLVWCKLRRFPYWPAVVKSIKRKAKKANVVLIEKDATEKKAKGFSIPLRNLKHFDCKEKQILINEAKEKYRDEIIWCLNFIIDYRIKVAGEAFVGSFLDYFASDSICKDVFHPLYQVSPSKVEETEESQSALGATDGRESPLETSPSRPAKKLLPDRSRAARDKANERIVDFIVKARRADGHLWAVLRQEKESRWLREFLAARPYYTCTETYLEDEGQQEQVLGYLRESFEEASSKMLLPRHAGGGIKFILDVMFPEAVIWAISAVDNLDYKTAEAKYLRGPLVSQRERKEFEEEILEKKRELEQRAGFLSPL